MMRADPEASGGCPPAELLACFLDGALDATAVARLEIHLSACDRCCSLVAELADAEVTEGGDGLAREDQRAISRFGRYDLLERIGVGGMGVVWAAYDTELERRVAIKLLRYSDANTPDTRARRQLVREARAMARVSHPNVVAVHDVVEEDERIFMTMELVSGRTLGAWLRERVRPWREIVRVFVAAGRGLAAAHAAGVVHRDFKPDNVLIDGAEHVRVGDFGLADTGLGATTMPSSADASALGRAQPDTISFGGTFVGTPAYMAPEQFVGGSVDARTDQFAFCVATWEALFGTRPFGGSTLSMLAERTTAAELGAPADRRGVPRRVEQVLRRGLARDPAERWPSMDALLRALEDAGTRQRWPWLVAATVVGGAIAAVLVRPSPVPCSETPPWLVSTDAPPASGTHDDAAADLARRLQAEIDERRAAMRGAFAASCRATFVDHTQTAEDHDARLGCLRRNAAAIAVIAEFAADADAARLGRALRTTAALAGADACDEIERVHSDQPWIATAVDRERAIELGIAVQEATQLRRLGDLAAARERLANALAVADDPGLGAIGTAAQLELAMIEQREGAGGDRLHRVLADAIAVGSNGIAFETLAQLVFDAGTRRLDLASAEAYAELAFAFLATTPRGDDGRGIVWLNLGQARERNGDPAAARSALLESEAAFTEAGTLEAPKNFPLWIALGLADELAGDLVSAEARYDDARARLEVAWGSFHPDVAVALEYLSTVRRKRGAYPDALAAAERSLAIRRAVLGPTHPETANSLANVGRVHVELRRWDEAEEAFTAALAISRATPGRERQIALDEGALAEVRLLRGDAPAALQRYREALAIGERTLGADHAELAYFLLGIGAARLALDEPHEAIAPLERALDLLRSGAGDPVLRAKVQLSLARALTRDGRVDRARSVAAAARSDATSVRDSAIAQQLVRDLDALLRE